MNHIKTFISRKNIPIHFPDDFHYECIGCGDCCRESWNIHVDPVTCENMKKTGLYERVRDSMKDGLLFVIDNVEGTCTITHKNEMCPFQTDNQLCMIHSDLGYQAKPLGCRQFPFLLVPTPDGIFVAVSHICPSVVENTGRALEEYLPRIEEWLDEYDFPAFGFGRIFIDDNLSTDWEGYKLLEEYILDELKSQRPPRETLWRMTITITMLAIMCRKAGKTEVSGPEILSYLKGLTELPFEMDELYLEQETQFANFLLTIAETDIAEDWDINLDGLKNRGRFNSRTFCENIDTGLMKDYTDLHPDFFLSDVLSSYFRHLIWQKFLLENGRILTGLGIMNIMYPFFDWYVKARNFTGRTGKINPADAVMAVGVVTKTMKHTRNGILKKYADAFLSSTMKQLEIFI